MGFTLTALACKLNREAKRQLHLSRFTWETPPIQTPDIFNNSTATSHHHSVSSDHYATFSTNNLDTFSVRSRELSTGSAGSAAGRRDSSFTFHRQQQHPPPPLSTITQVKATHISINILIIQVKKYIFPHRFLLRTSFDDYYFSDDIYQEIYINIFPRKEPSTYKMHQDISSHANEQIFLNLVEIITHVNVDHINMYVFASPHVAVLYNNLLGKVVLWDSPSFSCAYSTLLSRSQVCTKHICCSKCI